ncbi:MAG: thermonuclease family protein [Spirosomaceae bacterium]|nr:thermonuclease family protein [Spirosomataceae bacterium]
MKRIIFCFFLALAIGSLQAQLPLMQGKVIRVLDGDTFELLQNNTKIRCRIVEVDAPELRQPFGRQSGDSLRQMLLHQSITCRPVAHDQYHRWLVKVTHLNGHPVALDSIIVAKGWAWSVRGWHSKGYNLDADPIQADARWYSHGLWASPNPIPPWTWRLRNKTRKVATKGKAKQP